MNEVNELKDKYYKRNLITLCLEAFFFSGAVSIFSAESVLPVYVENLSSDPFCIMLISLIYYGVSYGVYIFSCPLGMNAKSPKWVSIVICFLQRIGFLFIYLSTFQAANSKNLALVLFFISLSFYSVSSGMSSPLFTQVVSVSIFRNISTFYGIYSICGAISGVLGSLIYTYCLKNYIFPINFRIPFLIGTISAVIASVVMSIGIKEVVEDRPKDKMKIADVLSVSKDILKNNLRFRNFTIVRLCTGATEFALPYYILTVLNKPDVPDGYAGVLTTFFLVSKILASYFEGKIGDKYGPFGTMLVCSISGFAATFLAIFSTSWQLSTLMYILVGFAVSGTYIATSSACIKYSNNKYVPIYNATVSLLNAPLFIVISLFGATLASKLSYTVMFSLVLIIFLISTILSLFYIKNDIKN